MPDETQRATPLEEIEKPEGLGNSEMGWGSDALAETIRRLGFTYMSITPGASYRGLHDSIINYLGNVDPKMLLCIHEDAAVAVAHGYAKVTDKPMVVALHANVGLMHSVMGIYNAWCDRAPMIIFGATGALDAPKRRHWIEWIHTARDQGGLIRPFTKWDDTPGSVQAAIEAILRGNQITRTAPKGPVYICMDVPVQEDRLEAEPYFPEISRYAPAETHPAPTAAVERAAEMLLAAKNPVLLLGRVSRSQEGWDARLALAETLNMKVITSELSPAAFPTTHPLHVDWPRPGLGADAQKALKGADVILSLDTNDLAGRLRTVWPDDKVTAKIIQVSVDTHSHRGWATDYQGLPPADCLILTEPEAAVPPLLELVVAARGKAKPMDVHARAFDLEAPGSGPLTLAHVAGHFQKATKGRKVTRTRLPFAWPADAFQFTDPLDYLGRDGGGGVGSAPGMGIGAALALREMKSDRFPATLCGDGEFVMGMQSLWTAARYNIPLLIVVGNNRSFFNDEVHQEQMAVERGRPVANKWIGMRMDGPAVDIAGIARDMGIESAGPITTNEDLPAALARGIKAIDEGRPFVIDCVVPPTYKVRGAGA
jgi:thiamine pyrophosphate-dependent acetolactate synthase large subunit-like protein